eukprot:366556-Chlamydomonas_euryale.AAC.1
MCIRDRPYLQPQEAPQLVVAAAVALEQRLGVVADDAGVELRVGQERVVRADLLVLFSIKDVHLRAHARGRGCVRRRGGGCSSFADFIHRVGPCCGALCMTFQGRC